GGSGVDTVAVSVKRNSDGFYWNGTDFVDTAGSEDYRSASYSTGSWSLALAHAKLTDGVTYTVHAKSTDKATNASTVASAGFRYDTSAPTAAVSFPADNGNYNAGGWDGGCTTAGLCGSASDTGGSGVDTVAVSVKRNSDGFYWNGTDFVDTAGSEDYRSASYSTGSWSL